MGRGYQHVITCRQMGPFDIVARLMWTVFLKEKTVIIVYVGLEP